MYRNCDAIYNDIIDNKDRIAEDPKLAKIVNPVSDLMNRLGDKLYQYVQGMGKATKKEKTVTKTTAKKSTAKKSSAKKTTAKKSTTTPAKKPTAKKAADKKQVARGVGKVTGKKTPKPKNSGKADGFEDAMKSLKRGKKSTRRVSKSDDSISRFLQG
jgi:hypothetical protein